MLKLAKDFDLPTQLGMSIHWQIALDPETGISMARSFGRRRSGRPIRYWVSTPEKGCGVLFRFIASSDAEALDKATVRLAKRAHERRHWFALSGEWVE